MKRRWSTTGIAVVVTCIATTVAASGSASVARSSSGGVSCGSGKASNSGKANIIIGMPIALSGALSGYDHVFLAGAQLAVADLNAKGGVLGRKLKIVTLDTKSDIPNTQNVALQVIDRGANFILPSVDFNFGGPAAKAAGSKCLIAITETGDPRFGFKGLGQYAYNSNQADVTEGAAMATYAQQRKWHHPYVLIDQTIDYTKSLGQFFQLTWKHLTNSDPAGVDTFQNGDASIATQISRLKNAQPKPDVIVISSFQPGQTAAVRQIRAAGITTPILGGVTFEGISWLKGVAASDPNVFAPSIGINGPNEPDPTIKDILDRYRQRSGAPTDLPTEFLNGYGSVQILAIATRRAGSTETPKVQKALNSFRAVNVPGLGPTTYTSTCHVPIGRPYIMVKPTVDAVQYLGRLKPAWIPPHIC